MEEGWVNKKHQRDNSRWMKAAIVLWVLVGVMQTIALARLPERKPGDPEIIVTLEDTRYVFPDGTNIVIDRQTWHTITTKPDGTMLINGRPVVIKK